MILVWLILSLLSIPVQAATVSFTWTAPTTNVDGTPLTDLAGYELGWGTTAGMYPTLVPGQGLQTALSLSLPGGQTIMAVVRALDTEGQRSAWSNMVTVAVPPDPLPMPVLAWALNEASGSTTADASGHEQTGILSSGASFSAGHYGNALVLSGTGARVTTPNTTWNNLAGPQFSLSLWARITDRSGPDMVLLSKPYTEGTQATPYYQYAIEWAAGRKQCDLYFAISPSAYRGPFSMSCPAGAWHHVAYTYDGSEVRGYLDSVLALTAATSGSLQARGQVLKLGVDSANGQAYSGLLDNVRIYPMPLSAAQVVSDRDTPVSPGTVPTGASSLSVTAQP